MPDKSVFDYRIKFYDYITAPCDNEACQHKDTSRSGCRKHSKYTVSICKNYKSEPAEVENDY